MCVKFTTSIQLATAYEATSIFMSVLLDRWPNSLLVLLPHQGPLGSTCIMQEPMIDEALQRQSLDAHALSFEGHLDR